jgi:uncharacterized protein YaaR (DUF327 family)
MIKIVPGKTDGDTRLSGKRTSGASKGASQTSFDSILSDAVSTETDLAVDSLMNDLSEQERRFLDYQSEYELNRYKLLLQKILKTLVSDSYQTKIIDRRSRNRADYLIINQINEKIDSLAKILVSPDNKAFSLMKTMEEIRGLIYDLRF